MLNYNWEKLLSEAEEALPWSDYNAIIAEAKLAQEIYLTARSIVYDAQTRYKKKKLNARNKKQAEDMKLRFADLEGYDKEQDIQDAYGWDFITEKEMDRLLALWQLREKYVDENGNYSDPVIDLLDSAMSLLFKPYANQIKVANRMRDIIEAQKKEKMLRYNN